MHYNCVQTTQLVNHCAVPHIKQVITLLHCIWKAIQEIMDKHGFQQHVKYPIYKSCSLLNHVHSNQKIQECQTTYYSSDQEDNALKKVKLLRSYNMVQSHCNLTMCKVAVTFDLQKCSQFIPESVGTFVQSLKKICQPENTMPPALAITSTAS